WSRGGVASWVAFTNTLSRAALVVQGASGLNRSMKSAGWSVFRSFCTTGSTPPNQNWTSAARAGAAAADRPSASARAGRQETDFHRFIAGALRSRIGRIELQGRRQTVRARRRDGEDLAAGLLQPPASANQSFRRG